MKGGSGNNDDPNLWRRLVSAGEKAGSSGGFRLRDGDKETHHAKPTLSKGQSDSALNRTEYVPGKRQLTPRTSDDLEMVGRKTKLAYIFCAAVMGKENVAEASYIKGALQKDGELQPLLLSRLNSEAEDLDRCTDAKKDRGENEERYPLTRYKNQPIDENLNVDGYGPIIGFGQFVAVAIAFGLRDLHPGNVALEQRKLPPEQKMGESGLHVYIYDLKFALGATEKLGPPFLVEELARKVGKYEAKSQELQALAKDEDNFSKAFAKEQQWALALEKTIEQTKDESDKERLTQKLKEYVQDSKTLFPLRELVEEGYSLKDLQLHSAKAQDFMPQGAWGVVLAENIQSMKQKVDDGRDLVPKLTKKEEIDALLQMLFPVKGDGVFNFPFSEHFANAPRIKAEFLEGMHLLSHMDKALSQKVVSDVMGDKLETPGGMKQSEVLTEQVVSNLNTIGKCIRQCPEYLAYVTENKGALDQKVAVMNATLQELGQARTLGSQTDALLSSAQRKLDLGGGSSPAPTPNL